MNNYWENRYKSGGNSGSGSYNEDAKHKADVINDYINKYDIKTISDFGCGDGNQISLFLGFENYAGFDISEYIINANKIKFLNNSKMSFCNSIEELPESDLCLSLDVIYHIVDLNIYNNYMSKLFSKSKKYVLIFSTNFNSTPENKTSNNYCFHHKFTDWIESNRTDFIFIEEIDNYLKTSAKFYLYQKI
jgi:2-polyprenyl-3-methyl-5-hydroxy-6-metoxy-1,4-benzoquinol methylase